MTHLVYATADDDDDSDKATLSIASGYPFRAVAAVTGIMDRRRSFVSRPRALDRYC